MISRSELQSDLERLKNDTTQMSNENDRLREIKVQMLAALHDALPILEECLPDTADPAWTEAVIAKIQNAVAAAQSDS